MGKEEAGPGRKRQAREGRDRTGKEEAGQERKRQYKGDARRERKKQDRKGRG